MVTVNTDDLTVLGAHELHLSASLEIYPSVVTASPVIFPIDFETCPVEIEPWVISDVTVPAAISVT